MNKLSKEESSNIIKSFIKEKYIIMKSLVNRLEFKKERPILIKSQRITKEVYNPKSRCYLSNKSIIKINKEHVLLKPAVFTKEILVNTGVFENFKSVSLRNMKKNKENQLKPSGNVNLSMIKQNQCRQGNLSKCKKEYSMYFMILP
jgi:hypothetical protein